MKIDFNGDHLGPGQQTVEAFLRRLSEYTLHPSFESHGNFVIEPEGTDGLVRVWGNFYDISAAFEFDGTPEEVRPLVDAIRANQATPRYKEARAEYLAYKSKRPGRWEKG